MNNSQTSPKTKTGFHSFSAEDINASNKIKIRDVEAIASTLGIKLPCTSNQKEQIVQFAADAASGSMTINQAIAAYQKVQQEQVPQGGTAGYWSQEPTLETEFSDVEDQLLAAANAQGLQNELAVAQMNGLLMEAQTQLALATGRKRMALMLQGLIQPSNQDEAALVETVKRATGVYQAKLLPFVQMGTSIDGRPQMTFQAIAPNGNVLLQGLRLLAASNGTGIMPQISLEQLMAQMQAGQIPTLQAAKSPLPLPLSAAPLEPLREEVAEDLQQPTV